MKEKTFKCPICGLETKYNMLKKHLERVHSFCEKDAVLYKIKLKNNSIDFEKVREDYEELEMSFQDIANKNSISRSDAVQIIEVVFGMKRRSNSESKKAKSYQKKYEKTIKEKYGVENVSQLQFIKEKKISTMISNYGVENNFCRNDVLQKATENLSEKLNDDNFKKELYDKIKNTLIDRYGVENASQIEYVKKENSRKAKERFGNLNKLERFELTRKARSVRFKNGNISNVELYVSDILNNLKINYKRNTIIQNKYPDFLLEVQGRKIIIEVQGDFWHLNPMIYKSGDINAVTNKTAREIWERDIKRSKVLQENGYEVFWFWENEKNSFEEKIIKILNKEEDEWNKCTIRK